MLPRLKSYFLSISILAISLDALSEINPHEFIAVSYTHLRAHET